MKKINALVLISLLLISASQVSGMPGHLTAGISFAVTRIIYPEADKKGITFTVTNNTDNIYLLQSRVITTENDMGAVDMVPFIVLPPLKRFEPGETVTLHIKKVNNQIDENKESLWLLALKTIPAQQNKPGKESKGTSLILALQNNLKLLYRPRRLTELTADQRSDRLQFAQLGSDLTVTNPTPYYITFSELYADGIPVNTEGRRTVGPFQQTRYSAEHSVSSVSWSIAGDVGETTGQRTRSLP